MQTSHDSCYVPLVMRYIFYGVKCAGQTGIEKDKKVETADQDNPEEKKGQRTQVIKRVPFRTKGNVKPGFNCQVGTLDWIDVTQRMIPVMLV